MEDPRTLYRQLLRSDGTTQTQRLSDTLKENYVQLEDRSLIDQLGLLVQLSRDLLFIQADGSNNGNWSTLFNRFARQGFLDPSVPQEDLESRIDGLNDLEPQLALVIAFLRLLKHSTESLNQFTENHLRYYYEQFLGFTQRPPAPDSVFVLFELAKNARSQLIPVGTLLDAGKTAAGQERRYRTTNDIIVNKGRIAAVRSLFAEHVSRDQTTQLWSASYDPEQLPGQVRPFGNPQSTVPIANRTMDFATTGLAIASPLFELSGGDRKITLTIVSEPFVDQAPAFIDLKNYSQFDLTGPKDWVRPVVEKAIIERDLINEKIGLINIVLRLSEPVPPISGHVQKLHAGGYPDGTPVLRMTTLPDKGYPDAFQLFRIATVSVAVEVKGLKNLILQNSEGVQPVDKPFNLFGTLPTLGTAFYLGSKEVFQKNVKQLTLHIQWKSPPADFNKHYAGYLPPSSFSNASFRASADLLLGGSWAGHQLGVPFSLFDAQYKDYPLTLTIQEDAFARANNNQPIGRGIDVPDLSNGFQTGILRGFIRITLTGPDYEELSAFGHNQYTQALTSAIFKKIQSPAEAIDLPQAPYTPQVQAISIDYSASETIFPGRNDQLYHVTPFGITPLKNTGVPLFPEYADIGYLHLGIADLEPQQQINILLTLAQNQAIAVDEVDADFSAPQISWSFLADDNWIEFRKEQILADSTKNLQQSGIISIQTSANSSLTNSTMPAGMIWLRARLMQGISRVLPLAGIHTQAMEAILNVPPGTKLEDYAAHLSAGIPADTIKKNIQNLPTIKSVRQPYASFGGRQPEAQDHLKSRISERLRHRNRSVQLWDFERLALDAFPGIAKIKCLENDELSVPGTVRVIVIPGTNPGADLADRLQPRGSSFFLDQIGTYLTARASAFTTVLVDNPSYEEILTDFNVKFLAGLDAVYYAKKLNDDLVGFISPWAFADNAPVQFDKELYRSEIIYFIEKRPYVDYIADFKLFHLNASTSTPADGIGKMKLKETFFVHRQPVPNIGGMTVGNGFIVGLDLDVITPSRPSAVLVSVVRHSIQIIEDERFCSGISGLGIGSMTVDVDFTVSNV